MPDGDLGALTLFFYLAGVELRKEEDLPFLWKAWWVLLVFLMNVVGFGVFWAWLLYYRHRHGRTRHA